MTDLTRKNFNSNKKGYSVSAATFTSSDLKSDKGESTLFRLPEKSLVKSVAIIVVAESNSATGVVRVGGASVITAVPLQTKGARYANAERDSSAATNTAILTNSGMDVTFQPSAVLTSGEFTVIVEYVEYTKRSSELTPYTEVDSTPQVQE